MNPKIKEISFSHDRCLVLHNVGHDVPLKHFSTRLLDQKVFWVQHLRLNRLVWYECWRLLCGSDAWIDNLNIRTTWIILYLR